LPMIVTCPACHALLEPTVVPGEKFACPCGQRMRLPPASANKTVFVKADDAPTPSTKAVPPPPPPLPSRTRGAPECPECGAYSERLRVVQIANPAGWACIAVGGMLLVVGLCVSLAGLLGLILILLGGSLRQRSVRCADCLQTISTGETRMGTPPMFIILFVPFAVLSYVVFVVVVVTIYLLSNSYRDMLNQY